MCIRDRSSIINIEELLKKAISSKQIMNDFQDKVAKPYIIAYNNRKYQFCPVDLKILKCEKFADIGESFFQFHIFFSALPDIKTPSR